MSWELRNSCPALQSTQWVEENSRGLGMGGGSSRRSRRAQGMCRLRAALPTHPRSHLGLLTPDPEDRIRSDLVPHFLGQVLGFLDGFQSLEGKHRPGLQAQLSDRGLGSQERKGPGGAGLGRTAWPGRCPACV